MMQAHTWKEEREKQNLKLNGKVYARDFAFTGRDAIQCVVGFRIDNRTIKRETLKSNQLSKCH
jgi:predicted nuclease of restriction endonuclease-like RecB superfamily